MRPQDAFAFEVYMPVWIKERDPGLWDFKQSVGNLWVDEKEKIW